MPELLITLAVVAVDIFAVEQGSGVSRVQYGGPSSV